MQRSRDFHNSRVTFFQSCFSMLFLLPLFAILAPKSLPKWSQNPTKIDEKIVSVAISKKVLKNGIKIMIFLLFFKRPMCLKHSKYCIRMTFSLLVNDPEKYAKNLQKMIQKTYQNPSKIGAGSYQNGVSKTERKNVSTNTEKCRKWTLKWGPMLGHILAIWPLFAVPGKPWEPK